MAKKQPKSNDEFEQRKINPECERASGDSATKHDSQYQMFEILIRLQSSRLDDQRCILPLTPLSTIPILPPLKSPELESETPLNFETETFDEIHLARRTLAKTRLQEALKYPPPYPLVILPEMGGFWMDPSPRIGSPVSKSNVAPSKFECEEFAKIYRNHFVGQEHFTLRAYDEVQGPLIFSIKICDDEIEGNQEDPRNSADLPKSAQVIARLNSGSLHRYIHSSELDCPADIVPAKLARYIVPDLSTDKFEPVFFPNASELILQYDEHPIVNKFKFGLIYQKVGQTTEEAMFGNQTHSHAMKEFMDCIGKTIPLADHDGYRGGLDTRHGQTGTYSLFEKFHGNEIMFHVSTFLPYVESDSQQLQRKCHIGNDIIAIVFQDGDTPFTPDMIISHFLHAFIIVRPINNKDWITTRYKITIAAKADVPQFGPTFPGGSNIIRKGPELKEFLLTKLINAETACYRAEKFSKLELRTRTSLLANLDQMLAEKTREFMSGATSIGSTKVDSERRQTTKIIDSWKKALSGKTKNTDTYQNNKVVKSKSSLMPFSSPSQPPPASTHSITNGGHREKRRGSISPVADSESGRNSVDSKNNLVRSHAMTPKSSGHGASESDNSSLNSTDDAHVFLSRRAASAASPSHNDRHEPSSGSGFSNVISGSVTTVPIEGQSSNSDPDLALQEESLEFEVKKLRGKNLELLRQIHDHQLEFRRLRERDLQLSSDLALATREILKLKREKENNNLPMRINSSATNQGIQRFSR